MSLDSSGQPAETGGKPIRVVLPAPQTPAPPPPPSAGEPEAEEERLSPQTGLVLGLIVAGALLVATLPTVVFFVLASVLAVLHREVAQPEKPLEEYARIIPEKVEQLFHRLRHPDGRLILLVLLLAGAVYLVHPIVFGLAGAAGLITALYLLDWLDRPAGAAMKWFSAHEEGWAASLRGCLRPTLCHLLVIVLLIPLLRHLAGVLLPRSLASNPFWLWGCSGGPALVLLGLLLFRRPGPELADAGARTISRDTLLVSMAALMLGVTCACVLMARRMRIPLLADPLEWNGIGLAVIPVLALGYWCAGYLKRAGAAGGEIPTWRLSAVATLILVGTGFLLSRALQLEDRGLVQAGSAGLFALILAGWLFAARLLAGLARGGPADPLPEWAKVHLATMASLVIAFFLVYFGGVWGLVLAVLPIVGVWKTSTR